MNAFEECYLLEHMNNSIMIELFNAMMFMLYALFKKNDNLDYDAVTGCLYWLAQRNVTIKKTK